MRDLQRELDAWDGEWPMCWRPAEGETLIGRIRLYSTGRSAFGPVRTAIVERDDGSKVSLWLSSTVLLALFKEHEPKVGERIGLKYCGKHPERGYRRWHLVVDRAAGEPSFEPLGGERSEDADPFADEEPEQRGPYAAATMGPARR